MRQVVFDIETDDLLPKMTTMHSLVLRDVETNAVLSCADQEGYTPIAEGLAVLSKAEKVYAHNGLGFDLPAIQKFYPDFKLSGRLIDTLIVAQMRFAHIKESDFRRHERGKLPGQLIGRHSLEAWGYRLGIHKGDCKDFSKWTPEMQSYCEQDTEVTRALVLHIREYGVSAEAVETEHELAAYLMRQEANGWPFDLDKAVELQGILAQRREELERELKEMFPPWQVSLGMFTPKVNNKKRGYVKGVPIERFKEIEFNPGSRQHIADRLQTLHGWKPTVYTASGQPQVDENTLKGLDYPPVKKLRDYLLVLKRLGQLSEGKEGWLRHVRLDPRTGLHHIYGRVKQSGTVTHRASHVNPNIAQVPKVGSPYGEECRALFHVPEGWVQMGVDVSGLELRCLAHYMAQYDDGAYGRSVLAEKPNDIHTQNSQVLGVERDTGKTWFYGWLYGAGDEKLGKIKSPGAPPAKLKAIGKKDRNTFLKGIPALGKIVDAVKAKAGRKGWLKLIDGRRVYIRSDHSALNSLLQGTGAVICKRWIVEFNRRMVAEFGEQGWEGKWAALGWIHDEIAVAVRPEIAQRAGEIALDSIRHMTQHFRFRLPLDGEAKFGPDWSKTH